MAGASSVAGTMCAVRSDIDTLRGHLDSWGLDVVVANHNHPNQVVLSGAVDAIEAVEAKCGEVGLDVRRLDVATAFHSPLVAGAAEGFREALEGIEVAGPQVAVYANGTAAPYAAEPQAIRDQLGRQLAESVRFVDVIEAMYADGVRTFVEVGPGHVLTGLTERILGDRTFLAVSTDRKGRDGVTQLLATMGRLFVAGVDIDAAALWDGYRAPIDPAARPKLKMPVPISGANYGVPTRRRAVFAALPGPNLRGPSPSPRSCTCLPSPRSSSASWRCRSRCPWLRRPHRRRRLSRQQRPWPRRSATPGWRRSRTCSSRRPWRRMPSALHDREPPGVLEASEGLQGLASTLGAPTAHVTPAVSPPVATARSRRLRLPRPLRWWQRLRLGAARGHASSERYAFEAVPCRPLLRLPR